MKNHLLVALFFSSLVGLALASGGCISEAQRIERKTASHAWRETQWHSCVTTTDGGRTSCVEGCSEIKVASHFDECHSVCAEQSRVTLKFCAGL